MTTALTHTDQQQRQPDDGDQRQRHPLDAVMPDPSGLAPMGDEAEFAMFLEGMVADEAPQLFAVVQEYGERVDGRIAAWGMAFADRAEIVAVKRGLRISLQVPEDALRMFKLGSHVRARLVWFNPDAATPTMGDEAA
jgi:hypothetical protein